MQNISKSQSKMFICPFVLTSFFIFFKTLNTRRYIHSILHYDPYPNFYLQWLYFPIYRWWIGTRLEIFATTRLSRIARRFFARQKVYSSCFSLIKLNWPTWTSTWYNRCSTFSNFTELKFKCVELKNSYCFFW